jgi:biopolymer transport protein ExbD
MSISSRKAGMVVQCPTCGNETLVPLEDIFQQEAAAHSPPDDVAPSTQAIAHPQPAAPLAENSEESPLLADMHLGISKTDDIDDDDTPAMTLRRRSRTDDDMDLTPMVDVTFQLLIFFMVTASFALQKSIDVPTPDPDKKGASQQLQILEDLEGSSIRVQIDAANAIMIDEEVLGDLARLPEALKDKMRKEQKTEILITAHAQSLHRSVISVIDAANSVGMQKIRLVSRQGKSE